MSQRAQRLIEAARKLPVPEGTYAVGLGLLISGITAYGFQILAFKGLTKSEYAALNGLWILVFVVAPGFFLPLEQEVGRAVADRRSRLIGGGPVVRKAAQAGLILALSLMALSVVGFEAFGFTDRLFHGQEVLLVCFVIALGTYAVQHITRGTLSGNGRFGPYGMILGAEGVFRILPVIVVYAAGVDDLLWYGLALAIPPVLASIVSVWGQHGLDRARSRRRVVGALDQPHAAVPRIARRPGPELRGRPRRARARAGEGGARCGGRLHRRVLHRPHPDPPLPGHPGRIAPEARRALRRRASTPTSARASRSWR